jgi:hypothetical protein
VHYDAEPGRRAEYHRQVADGMRAGFAADDGVALHFRGTSLERVVSERPDGAAYRVEPGRRGRRVLETPLEVVRLGVDAPHPGRAQAGAGAPAQARAGRRRGRLRDSASAVAA